MVEADVARRGGLQVTEVPVTGVDAHQDCGRTSRTSVGCKRGSRELMWHRNRTFLLLKNAITATSHPVFEA